ncbi:MAG: hypothetical protein ABSG79_17235 [Bryobacteraceae bacterium]|jgi:hypothetical protein
MKPLLVAGCALIVVCAAFLTVRAGAQPAILAINPQYVTFGMVGLASGQTARLNALALPVGGPIIAGASCQVTFDFYDATGKSLKTATLPVTQGAAVSYDLAWTEITVPTTTPPTNRAEIRGTVRAALVISSPVVTPVTPVTPLYGSCPVLPTMEIFDTSSGQTAVVLQQTTALSLVVPL